MEKNSIIFILAERMRTIFESSIIYGNAPSLVSRGFFLYDKEYGAGSSKPD
jgi:hypothetical protein